jgi:hypothetical protein
MTLLDLSVSTILIPCIAYAAILVYAPFLVVAYARVKVGDYLASPSIAYVR